VPSAGADLIAQIVPFHAGDLTRLAANAFGRVDKLGHLTGGGFACLGLRQRRCGATNDVKGLQRDGMLLDFLDLDQECLELGCLRIRIADRGGERIGEEAGFGHAHETPVDRYADDMQRFAIHM
jgi:hypothetical protein